jgi:hypothetical protein
MPAGAFCAYHRLPEYHRHSGRMPYHTHHRSEVKPDEYGTPYQNHFATSVPAWELILSAMIGISRGVEH